MTPDPRPPRPYEMLFRVLCLCGIALLIVAGAFIGLVALFLAANPNGFHV